MLPGGMASKSIRYTSTEHAIYSYRTILASICKGEFRRVTDFVQHCSLFGIQERESCTNVDKRPAGSGAMFQIGCVFQYQSFGNRKTYANEAPHCLLGR